MTEPLNIVKITSQKAIRENTNAQGLFITVIQSEGVADDGKFYRWLNDHWGDEQGWVHESGMYLVIPLGRTQVDTPNEHC